MKQAGRIFETICGKIVLVIGIAIFGILTYYSLAYTYVSENQTEHFVVSRDNIWINLLIFMIVLVIFGGVTKWFRLRKNSRRIIRILLTITLVLVTAVSFAWVRLAHNLPYGDQAIVYSASSVFLSGDYAMMGTGGYMFSYPQQYGLVFLFQLLFRRFGAWNYPVIQYLNLLCIPLLVYAGYRVTAFLFEKEEVQLYYLVLTVGCLPMYLYVPFVYSEIISITFSLVFVWQLLDFCKKGKWSSIIFATVSIAFSCMVRQNAMIVLIAAVIVLLISAIKNKNMRTLILAASIIIITGLTSVGVKGYYACKSGIEVGNGTPRIMYVAMGMQDDTMGAGWYNHYVYAEFERNNFEYDTTTIVGKEYIKGRIEEFKSNPEMAKDFYNRKILSQWIEPTCDGIVLNNFFDCTYEALPEITKKVYWGDWYENLFGFMNGYQSIIYIGLILGMIGLVIGKHSIAEHLIVIVLIGGFLFTVLWEAKSRYVLPYMVYMIPMASGGIGKVLNCGSKLYAKMRGKK